MLGGEMMKDLETKAQKQFGRRQALRSVASLGAAWLLSSKEIAAKPKTGTAVDSDLEIRISRLTEFTIRLSVLPIKDGHPSEIPWNGTLAQTSSGSPLAVLRGAFKPRIVSSGNLRVMISQNPLEFLVQTPDGRQVQRFNIDERSGTLLFDTGDSPLLGLGEGGPQFDRRGSTDSMMSGQGGYKLATHGGRVPIPWIIGTSGWAMFIHQPQGSFDLSGPRSKFQPAEPWPALDIFVTVSREPATILSEYGRITGYPEMLPIWALGYQQSHRTLVSREEVLQEAKTFRSKKLPCDVLIYLGTGFCPSGWNTANGSFAWNTRIFPDPKQMLDELHHDHFRIALHSVILSDRLRGTISDSCNLSRFDEEEAGCYWDEHRKNSAMGVDGWWPDEGDPLNVSSHVARHRMYWEGPQLDRPNRRPYALHRNGFAGMQRFGSVLWSGDVSSTWETLKTHVAIGINTALSGVPYWGTDIGGFVPTSEFTAELYVRWFQFGAFCPLFRSHGRTWKLRLPWGWNTGDPGPVEIRNYDGAATPDAGALHNPQVEMICRKYLELRYRLLPYLYSVMRECTATGMPILRALWLHYPDDSRAVNSGDAYLWGPNLLVAPVVEKAATARTLYLPKGAWFDFWTGEKLEGATQIRRTVDLETTPLYVRAGSILPMGPVKQYTLENVDEPVSMNIYPGANADFLLYEDDGVSFNYKKGEWTGIQMNWDDAKRTLRLRLAPGSKRAENPQRLIQVNLLEASKRVVFTGAPIEVGF
jgi:alpha-glucosidase (family GH31 glycosyl hydrolase)